MIDFTPWLVEKNTNVISSLITIHSDCKRLRDLISKSEELAEIDDIEMHISAALHDATKLLSHCYRLDVWDNNDGELILEKGKDGLTEILNRYERDSWDIEDITGA